jgi:hypothetical protein
MVAHGERWKSKETEGTKQHACMKMNSYVLKEDGKSCAGRQKVEVKPRK